MDQNMKHAKSIALRFVLYNQWTQQRKLDAEKHIAVSSHTNYHYLKTPQ